MVSENSYFFYRLGVEKKHMGCYTHHSEQTFAYLKQEVASMTTREQIDALLDLVDDERLLKRMYAALNQLFVRWNPPDGKEAA